MKTIRKINEKGFTLVEIIVVLVILAVLAAFTIPTMIGFVEEAKAKAYIAEAREVYVAAQATATEYTGKDPGKLMRNTGQGSKKDQAQAIGSKALSGGDGRLKTDATETMRNYLGEDIDANTLDAHNYSPQKSNENIKKGFATWSVKLGTGENAGKVIEIVYCKYNYIVTLEVGSSTNVEKIEYRP